LIEAKRKSWSRLAEQLFLLGNRTRRLVPIHDLLKQFGPMAVTILLLVASFWMGARADQEPILVTWAQPKNGNSKGNFDGNRPPEREGLKDEGASRTADEDTGCNACNEPEVA
jgi:hypothetical protein